MANRKLDYEQVRFLYSHGWRASEIANKLKCHQNTVWLILKKFGIDLGAPENNLRLEEIEKVLKLTKERIERMLVNRNPIEFTYEENLIELLHGYRNIIRRKYAMVKNLPKVG